MGFLDNFLGKINLNGNEGEDEYDGYDEAEDEQDEEDSEEYAAAAKSSAPKSEYRKAESQPDEEDIHRKKSFKSSSSSTTSNPKVVPIRSSAPAKQAEVCMILPKGYENSNEIAELLLQGKTVVLNMEGMNIDAAQRIIDFTSGACFTMAGSLQKISKKIFIATPSSVELSGDFVNLLGDKVDMASLNLTL